MQNLRTLFQLPSYEPFADTNDINDYLASIPRTGEQNREASILQDMDARASASLDRDLGEAEAVRSARNLGFDGTYPVRQQQEDVAMKKLQQLLMPKQIEQQTEMMKAGASQAEAERSRAAAMERAQLGQTGQDRRAAEGRTHALNMAKQTGRIQQPGILSSFFGLGGGTAEPETPIGARKVLPNGIEVEWDGTGWAGVE
jgi:hypothetical protein